MGSSSALIESPASWWDSLAENFLPYLTIYAEEWDSLVEEFLRHLAMTCFAVVLALIIAVPLGIFITRSKKVSSVVIGIANVMQSIPCMALLAMGIPFLGVGETLAIFMVFVYAFLPILKNTYTGISSISPVSLEVARGIGLTRMQQLGRVELPMATPYIMSGIRIAAVGAVGTMTIAAFAGANGLGWFIMLGMNSLNYPMTVMGAVASAVMALTLDYLLGRVERALTSEGLLPPRHPMPPSLPEPIWADLLILKFKIRKRSFLRHEKPEKNHLRSHSGCAVPLPCRLRLFRQRKRVCFFCPLQYRKRRQDHRGRHLQLY